MVWAVILAAGESRRMGSPKLLLPFEGSTVLGTVVHKARCAGLSSILVVLGAEQAKVRAALDGQPVVFAQNPDFRRGMLSSIKCGLQALPPAASAAMLFLADQPTLSDSVVKKLLKAREGASKGLIVPVFAGKRGHPLLLSLKYRAEVETLDPDVGLRQLLINHPEDVLEVEVTDEAVLNDIDTPEDYRQASASRPGNKA
jgi:molybdenum cofactor cytidylyltransferase